VTTYEELQALQTDWLDLRKAQEEAADGAARAAATEAATAALRNISAAAGANVAALHRGTPVLMLPVRLETRYRTGVDGMPVLQIKVYPDDIHLAGHQQQPTSTELQAAQRYWAASFAAAAAASRRNRETGLRAAWGRLVAATGGARRARWMSEKIRPTNTPADGDPVFPQLPAARESAQPTYAELLPDMWVAQAWRDGHVIATATGSLIPRQLPLPPPQEPDAHPDPTLWEHNFYAAVRNGMGIEMPLPPAADVDGLAIDLLTVVGVRASTDAGVDPGRLPAANAEQLEQVLDGHRHHMGLDLVPQGAPTNNSTAAPSALPPPDPSGQGDFADPWKEPPDLSGDSDATLLAKALGIDPQVLAGLNHSQQRGVAAEGDMLTLLLPATLRYYCTQMLRLRGFDDHGEEWLRWVRTYVRGGGPLPVLRCGNQPYGILPATLWRPADEAALISVELVGEPGGTTRTQVRVLAEVDPTGQWHHSHSYPLDEAPADVSAVTLAAALPRPGTDPVGRPPRVVAGLASPSAPAGIRCLRMVVGVDGPEEVAEVLIGDGTGGLPDGPLLGFALAVGPVPPAPDDSIWPLRPDELGRRPDSVVAVLQFALPNDGPQTLLFVERPAPLGPRPLPVGGRPQWARVDVSDWFAEGERVVAAAVTSGPDDTADLVVVSEREATAGDPSLAWHLARDLRLDGTAAHQGATPYGPPADPTRAGRGTALTLADTAGDGQQRAVLSDYRQTDSGQVEGLYTVAAVTGLAGAPTDRWAPRELGIDQAAPHAGEHLAAGAAVWVPWSPLRQPGLGTPTQRVNLLRVLRDRWTAAVKDVPRIVGVGDDEVDDMLKRVLTTDAVSETVHKRKLWGPALLDLHQRVHGRPSLDRPSDDLRTVLTELGLQVDTSDRSLLVHGGFETFVTDMLEAGVGSPAATAAADRRAELVKMTPRDLHDAPTAEDTWPALLLRHALLTAYADAALRLVPPTREPFLEPELIDFPDPNRDVPPHTLTSWRHLDETQTPDGTPVAHYILTELAREPLDPALQELHDVIAAAGRLAGEREADFARLAGSVLDVQSYRLDAWLTAVATQRLQELRARTPDGVHLAGYGLVCDLRPAEGKPTSTGHWLSPGYLQAAAGSVLRHGFSTHPDTSLYSLDLSPDRVRRTLDLRRQIMGGTGAGHALGALIEDGLARLKRQELLPAFRELAPLDLRKLTPGPTNNDDATTLGGLVRIDGVALLQLHRENKIPWGDSPGGHQLPAGSDEQQPIKELLDKLADGSAAAQMSLHEGMTYLMMANPELAKAALSAVDTAGAHPATEPAALRTPRLGVEVKHRLLLAAPNPDSPVAQAALGRWPATPEQRALHYRAAAEPRLNAWAACVLGDPANVSVWVQERKDNGEEVRRTPYGLEVFGLSPWDILAGPPATVASLDETNLGQRLLRHARNELSPARGNTLTLLDVAPDDDSLTLRDLLWAAGAQRDLLGAARAAGPDDLKAAGSDDLVTAKAAEIEGRAGQALAALEHAKDGLRALYVLPGGRSLDDSTLANLLDLPVKDNIVAALQFLSLAPDPDEVTKWLDVLSRFGIGDTVARDGSGNQAGDLAVQARRAAIDAGRRISVARAARDDGDGERQLREVFGDGFLALPVLVREPQVKPADARVEAGVQPGAVDDWLDGLAEVKAAAQKMRQAMLASGAVTAQQDSWELLQLPLSAPRRWVGLPVERPRDVGGVDGDQRPWPRIPAGVTSLVVSTVDPSWWTNEELAAVCVESTNEVVPSEQADVSLALHFDAPNATPPQAALLAVPPDPAGAWSPSLLVDIVRETLDLAKLRLVDLDDVQDLGHMLPVALLAHNVGQPVWDPHGDAVSTQWREA
jgi:hypothetical protein